VAQLYPQAPSTHFIRLLRHAWATVGLFFSPVTIFLGLCQQGINVLASNFHSNFYRGQSFVYVGCTTAGGFKIKIIWNYRGDSTSRQIPCVVVLLTWLVSLPKDMRNADRSFSVGSSLRHKRELKMTSPEPQRHKDRLFLRDLGN
jgi:hypothetical protein